jgi:recombination protein RecA
MAKATTEAKSFTMADFAKKLNKEYSNNNLIIKSNVVPSYTRLASGQMGVDYPLYGGLPYGRMAVFAGLEHSGKTTAACAQLAAYQRENPDKICVYVDVEHSLDIQFQALMNGIDLERLYYISPEGMSGEQILEMILELEETDDIGLIVLDSIPALVPQNVMENEFSKDMGMRGNMAKGLHKFCPTMCDKLARKGNIMIMINQVRVAGKTFTGANIYSEPGGDAPRYYASVKVRFGKRVFMKDGDEIKGDDGEGADGFRLKFKITKNKTCACNRGGGFASFSYEHGADKINDLIDVALQFDFIKRINNVTYALVNLSTGEVITDSETGETLQGKKAFIIDYLKTHEAFRDKYLEMIKQFISASNDKSVLDKEALKAIEAEEDAIERPKEDEVKRKILLEGE